MLEYYGLRIGEGLVVMRQNELKKISAGKFSDYDNVITTFNVL